VSDRLSDMVTGRSGLTNHDRHSSRRSGHTRPNDTASDRRRCSLKPIR
jgi:hypothetical protein